ncbi:hypothetical protein SMI01S_24320 [Sphingobacterium mizutaii NBRC 14946 = DSM 11724]|uniref:HTH araC/xylS-type domain-containing protein n=2 Tax=Sphingobacterium mizutaii TaxID=1010 RepID=A0ABQ0W772_9SPHI|nr:hypothetical protein SMI01S_24320 [Sphingobacterium mizutaii NBRC 14946 = DSM 11724]
MEIIWKNIIHLSKNELAGFHFGTSMQLAALGIVGQVIQMSSTVKDALKQACAMVHLLTDFYSLKLEEKDKTFTITFEKLDGHSDKATAQDQMGDFLLSFILYEVKGLVLENPLPIQASFPTYKKQYQKEYEAILGCHAKKSENYILEFKKKYLNTKIITANYEIQSLLIDKIGLLQNPSSLNGDLSKRIFNFLIANSFLFSLSIESVSGNFNISVRTLQRQLKQEGVSYLQIVEEVRKSLAINYITNSASSVKEISSILGYAESSAFVRAFKKWTGKTATEYRKSQIIQ